MCLPAIHIYEINTPFALLLTLITLALGFVIGVVFSNWSRKRAIEKRVVNARNTHYERVVEQNR